MFCKKQSVLHGFQYEAYYRVVYRAIVAITMAARFIISLLTLVESLGAH